MPIISSTIESIDAKRNRAVIGKIMIENKPTIERLKKTKIITNQSNTEKIPGLIIDYKFVSEYKNEQDELLAEITIKGKILYTVNSEKTASELEAKYNKDKKIDPDTEIEILNYILQNVTINALEISRMMELPAVIKMPRIVKRRDQNE